MAITAEQAAAISTAIENLNKSVQVNEEVLNIIKSMQTVGSAASVAEHNVDVNAHEQGIGTVFAQNRIYVKSKGFETNPAEKNNPGAIRLEVTPSDNKDFGNATLYLFSRLEADKTSYYPAIVSTSVLDKDVTSASLSQSRVLGSFHSRVWDQETSTYKNAGSFQTTWNPVFKNFASTISVTLVDGTFNTLYLSDNRVAPIQHLDLGSTVYQWKDLYIQNSPTVSSDRRLKQDFSSVPDVVFKAWEKVNFCQYKFKEAVEKKGAEARLHVGLVAQEILEAFEAQGLDATKYGIVCHDSWEDQYQDVEVGTKPVVLNEKGEVIKPEEPIMERQLIKPAGDLWTVRYEEALALEAAYQRWKLQKIEAALAEKGISL